jgi:hypothetical protein
MWRAVKSWLSWPARSVVSGTVADVSAHIQRLLNAPEGSFLIIALTEGDDAFLQFTAGPETIQIDHPLITANQIQREDALRRVLAAARLTPYEIRESDGSRFLDCDVPRDAVGAAILVRKLLESLFDVTAATELRFIGEGLPPPV